MNVIIFFLMAVMVGYTSGLMVESAMEGEHSKIYSLATTGEFNEQWIPFNLNPKINEFVATYGVLSASMGFLENAEMSDLLPFDSAEIDFVISTDSRTAPDGSKYYVNRISECIFESDDIIDTTCIVCILNDENGNGIAKGEKPIGEGGYIPNTSINIPMTEFLNYDEDIVDVRNVHGVELGICIPPTLFLIIDEDSVDNGLPPNFFSDTDINDDIADLGLREQLPFFAANVGQTIKLWTGEVGDEAWFAPTTIPNDWVVTGPTADGIRNFVGDPTNPSFYDVGKGLGNIELGDPEEFLDKIPDVIPLRAEGLALLVGKDVCAVVFDSDSSINYDKLVTDGSLKGANLGVVAFTVTAVDQLFGESSSSLPIVTLNILDASITCAETLGLFTEAPVSFSSSEPFDISIENDLMEYFP